VGGLLVLPDGPRSLRRQHRGGMPIGCAAIGKLCSAPRFAHPVARRSRAALHNCSHQHRAAAAAASAAAPAATSPPAAIAPPSQTATAVRCSRAHSGPPQPQAPQPQAFFSTRQNRISSTSPWRRPGPSSRLPAPSQLGLHHSPCSSRSPYPSRHSRALQSGSSPISHVHSRWLSPALGSMSFHVYQRRPSARTPSARLNE
jgi:hypothetical protein